MKQLHQSQAGYTLLEVILGTFILAIVVIPVSLYWNDMHQLINLINLEDKAVNLAEDSIARMQSAAQEVRDRNSDGNEANNIYDFEAYLDSIAEEESETISDSDSVIDLIREVEVDREDDNLKQITVEVNSEQQESSVKVDTLVYSINPVGTD